MQDEALLNGDSGLDVITSACRAAYEVDHLPLLALLVYAASFAIDKLGSHEQQLRFYDNAMNLTESLEQEGDTWKRMLDELLVKWLRLTRGDRMAELQYHGPDTDDKEEFLAAVQAVTDIQHAISYLDGSVPESICDRLTRVHEELDSETEGRMYPWLDRGFRSVRERVPDELIRWRYGFAQPDAVADEVA